jgi:hypothetical protein
MDKGVVSVVGGVTILALINYLLFHMSGYPYLYCCGESAAYFVGIPGAYQILFVLICVVWMGHLISWGLIASLGWMALVIALAMVPTWAIVILRLGASC